MSEPLIFAFSHKLFQDGSGVLGRINIFDFHAKFLNYMCIYFAINYLYIILRPNVTQLNQFDYLWLYIPICENFDIYSSICFNTLLICWNSSLVPYKEWNVNGCCQKQSHPIPVGLLARCEIWTPSENRF